MTGICNINGTDAYVAWGVIFTDASLSALRNFAPLKPYITNEGAKIDGVQVLSTGSYTPKVDKRDLTLVFFMYARNTTQFNQRLDAFETEMRKGAFTLSMSERPNTLYRLQYQSCNQFTSFNGRLAKFTLKCFEPNPNNRAAE